MLIRGGCHCGNVSFALTWEPDPSEIPARACDCTFCRKHGGVWTSHPAATLKIAIANPSLVSIYAFATKTAEFHVCARCGVVPVVTSRLDGDLHAVVNVNTFENVEPAMIRPAAMRLEGEETAARLARRKRNWIAQVEFVTPPVAEDSAVGGKGRQP